MREIVGPLLYYAARKRKGDLHPVRPLVAATINDRLRITRALHDSLEEEQLSQCKWLIITGPPGVGKSVYLATQFNQLITAFDLAIRLSPADIQRALDADHSNIIWDSLLRSVTRQDPTTVHPFDSLLFAYMLSHARVVIIVDDLHVIQQPTAEVLNKLDKYFHLQLHCGEQVKIFCTTRKPQDDFYDRLPAPRHLVHLTPLSQDAARNLFYEFCHALSVPNDILLNEYDLIQKEGFKTEFSRVPLFVALCAILLACDHNDPLPLARILKMTAVELLEAFVITLYSRSFQHDSPPTPTACHRFQRYYSCLAYDLWPDSTDLDQDRLESVLRGLPGTKHEPLDRDPIEFLTENGFLIRDETTYKLAFPHQSVADYLAALYMARHNDFHKLEEYHGSLDTIRPILSDIVEDVNAVELLFHHDPETALSVLRGRRFVGTSHRPNLRTVGQRLARWAGTEAPHTLRTSVWSEAREIFTQFDDKGWLSALIQEINTTVQISDKAIVRLNRVGYPETRRILEKWLTFRTTDAAFDMAASDNPEVRRTLNDVLRTKGASSEDGCGAFGVLWRRKDTLRNTVTRDPDMQTVEDFLHELRRGERPGELTRLVRSFRIPILAILGNLSKTASLREKRALSNISVKEFNRVLVSPGPYAVPNNRGTSEDVFIADPLWIPCDPDEADIRLFTTIDDARSIADEVASTFMSFDEFRVVLKYYRPNDRRLLFAHPYEAFRSTATKTTIYSVGSCEAGSIVVPVRSNPQTNRPIGIVLRPVTRLTERALCRSSDLVPTELPN